MEKKQTVPACGYKEQKAGEDFDDYIQRVELEKKLESIQNKIVVLSGKGGVGKSTVAANLAMSLALAGRDVGLLDVDIHGPSIPKLLKLDQEKIETRENKLVPVGFEKLKVMSVGFLLQNKDDAVIWRGPMKMNVIKQFLSEVEWGALDDLVIDCPPGTGDEPLSVVQLIEGITGAVVVTTPQEIALQDVRKSINFCRKLGVPVLGVVENMSGLLCPKCGERIDLFKTGGGEQMAREMNVPFLGRIPLDPQLVEAGDAGRPFVYFYSKTETAKAFEAIARPILEGA